MRICSLALSFLLALTCSCNCPNEKQDEITVISYNIRVGTANDGNNSWEYRKVATPAMITDQAPDIFGVQEACKFQIDYIKEQCPDYESIGVGRDDGKEKGEHMSIFYNTKRIELIEWGTYWLSETPDVPSKGWDAAYPRSATWSLLHDKNSGNNFYYVNTHLDHIGREAQKNGLKLIVDNIRKMNSHNYPMILTGDFNVDYRDEVLSELNSMMSGARNFAEKSDTTITFNGWGELKSSVIDHIYYSGFSKCDLFEVINKSYEGCEYISDHYPVKAILKY